MIRDAVALIPARAGSRGLPGKNVRSFQGRPLLEWSLIAAEYCDSIFHSFISSDSQLVRSHSMSFPKGKSLRRPSKLAADDTPMSSVVRHCAVSLSRLNYDFLVLLDPTSPIRDPSEIETAIELLRSTAGVAGVVSVSAPTFNPRWVGVEMTPGGQLSRAFAGGHAYVARQQVPPFYRMNGKFIIWRRDFAEAICEPWLESAPHLGFETSEGSALSIDTEWDFQLGEALLTGGLVSWKFASWADDGK